MKLELNRYEPSSKSMLGELLLDGKFECFTLEDITRQTKVFGETAIPAGTYTVVITYSNHFGFELPLLLKVTNYEGVRIHSGNVAGDTEGCILVGKLKGVDFLGQSRVAFKQLFQKMKIALTNSEKITITIKDAL